MIKINDLGFTYGETVGLKSISPNKEKGHMLPSDRFVLKNITMNLEEGRIYGLLGENGVGKTTLLTLLCGLKKPQIGSIDIDGHDPYKREPSLLSDQYYLSDEVAPMNMKAEDYARNYGKFWEGFDIEKFMEVMAVLDNDPQQKMTHMSFGQLKKTYIAFALACNTKYLFMDEPTLGLDVLARRELWQVIEGLRGHITVVLTTHYLEEAEALSDRVGVMAGGRLLALGTARELIDRAGAKNFEDAFVSLAAGREMIA